VFQRRLVLKIRDLKPGDLFLPSQHLKKHHGYTGSAIVMKERNTPSGLVIVWIFNLGNAGSSTRKILRTYVGAGTPPSKSDELSTDSEKSMHYRELFHQLFAAGMYDELQGREIYFGD
jgi:hypothetical protein